MFGSATLVDGNVEAEFFDGRLAALWFRDGSDRAAGIAAGHAAGSFVRVLREGELLRLPFASVSAFAFDGGLREVLALGDDEARGGRMSLTID